MMPFILFLALGGLQPAADVEPAPDTAEASSTVSAAPDTETTAHTASVESSQDRLICRSRPVVGSRIARQRVCKTAEEWRIYQADLEQSRRDINDRGMRGCTVTSCE